MISKWTNEEIEKILMQLESMDFPFKKFRFRQKNYRLDLIGSGGFSNVYEAYKPKSSKRYAIKVIGFGDMHIDLNNFRSAAEAQERLDLLDNVVKVYDHVELLVQTDEDGNIINAARIDPFSNEKTAENGLVLCFIAMERLDPVLSYDKAGRLTLRPAELAVFSENEIIKLAKDIASAIDAAHKIKLLHRDIKLENIFYDPKKKKYKLGDFGISKLTKDGAASTIAFTKGYGAPEVVGAIDNKYDCTADIYSFGILLYVLMNELRFPDSTNYNVNIKAQYTKGYCIPPSEHTCGGLYDIVSRMCAFDPDDRYQSAEEITVDLTEVTNGTKMRYKVAHRRTFFIMFVIMLALGVVSWKLTQAPEQKIGLTGMMYLFGALCLGKGAMKALDRSNSLLDLPILGIGIYLLVTSGFSWLKLILLIFIVLSSGPLAALFEGIIMLTDVIDRTAGSASSFEDCSWIMITAFILALTFGIQYLSLIDRDSKEAKIYLHNDRIPKLTSFIFLSLIIISYGIEHKPYSENLAKLLGSEFITKLISFDLNKVGFAGIIVMVIWIIREQIMMKRERQEQKKTEKQ